MTPGSTKCKKIQYEFKWRRTNQDAYNVSDAYAIEQTKKLQKKKKDARIKIQDRFGLELD